MAVVVMVEEQEEKVDGREKTHGGLRIGMDSLGEALLNGENPSIFLIIPDLQTPSASPFIRLSQSLFLSRSRFSAFHAVTQLCTRCNHKCNATTGTPPPRSLARSLARSALSTADPQRVSFPRDRCPSTIHDDSFVLLRRFPSFSSPYPSSSSRRLVSSSANAHVQQRAFSRSAR